MIQNGSHRYTDLKITFKNPRWRTADAFERPILHYHEISRFFDCQDQAFLNSNFFTVVHFMNTFCVSVPNFDEIRQTVTDRVFAFFKLNAKIHYTIA